MIVANSVFARLCAGLFGPFGCYDISAVFFADIVGCLRSCMILNNMPDSANSFGREKNSAHTICTLFLLNIRRSRLLPCKITAIMAIKEILLVFACVVGRLRDVLRKARSYHFEPFFMKNERWQVNGKTGRKERKRTKFKEKKEVKGRSLHYFEKNIEETRYTICILAIAGCYLKLEGTSHSLWINPKNGNTEAVPRHTEIKEPLAKKILKNLNAE